MVDKMITKKQKQEIINYCIEIKSDFKYSDFIASAITRDDSSKNYITCKINTIIDLCTMKHTSRKEVIGAINELSRVSYLVRNLSKRNMIASLYEYKVSLY